MCNLETRIRYKRKRNIRRTKSLLLKINIKKAEVAMESGTKRRRDGMGWTKPEGPTSGEHAPNWRTFY